MDNLTQPLALVPTTETPFTVTLQTAHPRKLTTAVVLYHWRPDTLLSEQVESSLFRSIHATSVNLLVTDDKVGELYLKPLLVLLRSRTPHLVPLIVPSGEGSKSIGCYSSLIAQALLAGATRWSTVISLGGGVVKDLAGMLAATLLRGVNLIHIPTTLLAQLDAAIDFNQALNMPHGKNLVGTFYAASTVWVNPIFLQTLSPRGITDGLCESVKHALCHGDTQLLQDVCNANYRAGAGLARIIQNTIGLKASLFKDESDLGEAIKQYGHCIGHAFEHLRSGEILHGLAVAYGMCVSAEIGLEFDITPLDLVLEHYRIFNVLGLQHVIASEIEPGAIWQQVHRDKNFRDGCAYVSLLSSPGTLSRHSSGSFFHPCEKAAIEQGVSATLNRTKSLYGAGEL